jgi:hypothetical protein
VHHGSRAWDAERPLAAADGIRQHANRRCDRSEREYPLAARAREAAQEWIENMAIVSFCLGSALVR